MVTDRHCVHSAGKNLTFARRCACVDRCWKRKNDRAAAAAVTLVLIYLFDFAVIHSLLSRDPAQCHDTRKNKTVR